MAAPIALLAKWPWRKGRPVILQRPEGKISWFVSQGWTVIARDSAMTPETPPLQMNPRRIITPGEDV